VLSENATYLLSENATTMCRRASFRRQTDYRRSLLREQFKHPRFARKLGTSNREGRKDQALISSKVLSPTVPVSTWYRGWHGRSWTFQGIPCTPSSLRLLELRGKISVYFSGLDLLSLLAFPVRYGLFLSLWRIRQGDDSSPSPKSPVLGHPSAFWHSALSMTLLEKLQDDYHEWQMTRTHSVYDVNLLGYIVAPSYLSIGQPVIFHLYELQDDVTKKPAGISYLFHCRSEEGYLMPRSFREYAKLSKV